ncbi:hypothetical protein GALMADRAFT_133470 [Galerina marginata CBS 339.88]|uniref:GATA-type domain-containing protein n=1 Tax=Galerina marginata (strain CBS 339.88) TaxID=685588 RepID=A0A067TVY9_GALM3|nr:hypothetical protein GALMADRAFT_133470 [Galerina marginata CBS 339.88]
MDSLSFDGYTSYSDASTPRTPSPTDMHFQPVDFKQDIDHPVQNIFPGEDDNSGAVVVPASDNAYWSQNSSPNPHPFSFNNTSNNSRTSLLQELYEPEMQEQHSLSPNFQHTENWNQQQQQQQQQQHHRSSEYPMMRRATFPYVRHDREDGMPMQHYPPFMQHHHHQQMLHHQQHHHHNHPDNLIQYSSRQELYGEPHPLDHGESFIPSMSNSPHSSYHEFDENNIKLEDGAPLMVPSQTSFYRPSSSPGACHPMTMSYLSPHTGLPVQHTDDAASKETQYLRRRCFNCHTTEPPSWRRSTLNPGKIVCNKCGLYERTHLRPRPLRFDELRAGNKARKQSKAGANGSPNPSLSPKQGKMVKKEPREYGGALVRRSSVSSSSSVHSGSGVSDWDDNVSIYSSGSAPPTSFNSPVQHEYPLSRDDSQSPPRDGGIRLPNNPLSDIASMHMGPQSHHLNPRKSHTSPGAYFAPSPALSQNHPLPGSANGSVNGSPAVSHAQLHLQQQEYFAVENASGRSSPVSMPAAVAVGSS